MDITIKNAHLFYEDTFEIPKTIDYKCDCYDNTYVEDMNGFFICCSKCGVCIDTTKEKVIGYIESKYLIYRNIRLYKRSAYLKLKLNNIFRNILPVLPEIHLSYLKKKNNVNITDIIKYMKKKKLIKNYDPLKSLYIIKHIDPIQLSDRALYRLTDAFNKKEKIYHQNGYKRFNYNFLICKIFEEWNEQIYFECFKSLQDDAIMEKHSIVYNKIFN